MTSEAQYQRDNNLATRIAFHETYTAPYVASSRRVLKCLPKSTPRLEGLFLCQ